MIGPAFVVCKVCHKLPCLCPFIKLTPRQLADLQVFPPGTSISIDDWGIRRSALEAQARADRRRRWRARGVALFLLALGLGMGMVASAILRGWRP
jgi:hypothetical protein